MRVGISYWGFLEDFRNSVVSNTPDGHRFGRPILVNALNQKGHKVYSLQQRRESTPYEGVYSYDDSDFPDIDVLLVEWRWPTYKNSGKNPVEPDLKRQEDLLNHYHGTVPVVIWDCDYKLTAEDELRWPQAIIADPALKPKHLTRKREQLMFWTDWQRLMDVAPASFEYGYVGNNYERDDQFSRYYGNSAKYLRSVGVQTTVHGNWLQRSPERADPSTLIMRYPNIAFGQRLGFRESMERLNTFITTTHISKPDYSECGFVSPRFLENLATGTPALVPIDLFHREVLGSRWVVDGPGDVIRKVIELSKMTIEDRIAVIDEQTHEMKKNKLFDVTSVIDFLTSTR